MSTRFLGLSGHGHRLQAVIFNRQFINTQLAVVRIVVPHRAAVVSDVLLAAKHKSTVVAGAVCNLSGAQNIRIEGEFAARYIPPLCEGVLGRLFLNQRVAAESAKFRAGLHFFAAFTAKRRLCRLVGVHSRETPRMCENLIILRGENDEKSLLFSAFR